MNLEIDTIPVPNLLNPTLEDLMKYIKTQIDHINNPKIKEPIEIFFNLINEKRNELNLIEIEYLILIPFTTKKQNIFAIKYPKIERNEIITKYISTYEDEKQSKFEKKLLSLPSSAPRYMYEIVKKELELDDDFDKIIDKVTVSSLPSEKCLIFIDKLHELGLCDKNNLPSNITITQQLLSKPEDYKMTQKILYEQNSKALIENFKVLKRVSKFLRHPSTIYL